MSKIVEILEEMGVRKDSFSLDELIPPQRYGFEKECTNAFILSHEKTGYSSLICAYDNDMIFSCLLVDGNGNNLIHIQDGKFYLNYQLVELYFQKIEVDKQLAVIPDSVVIPDGFSDVEIWCEEVTGVIYLVFIPEDPAAIPGLGLPMGDEEGNVVTISAIRKELGIESFESEEVCPTIFGNENLPSWLQNSSCFSTELFSLFYQCFYRIDFFNIIHKCWAISSLRTSEVSYNISILGFI